MHIEKLDLDGLVLVTPRRAADARGWFSESWNSARAGEAGLPTDFVQDNHVYTAAAGTLRGLHYQAPPFAQTKLVRCLRGRIFDVAVDIRRGSPHYGRWRGVILDAADGRQLLVPRGFLHGYLTLTPDTEVLYKVDAPYAPAQDGAVLWCDAEIGVDWPLAEAGVTEPLLSDKDAQAPTLSTIRSPFSMNEA